ncbi:MAG: M48 family metalloprotease [Cyclobacteriaceae bacterium]
MRSISRALTFLAILLLVLNQACDSNVPELFSIEDEKALATELLVWVGEDSTKSVFSPEDYPQAYSYAQGIIDDVFEADSVNEQSLFEHAEDFAWEVFFLNDADINAFVTPGGKIFVNSGLIQLLESKDEFASLIFHLMAHADQRHATKQLLISLSITELKQAAQGTNSLALNEIGENLLGERIAFSFSQGDEKEVDNLTVEYLALGGYACDAAKGFYQELNKREQQGNPPAFYNAHGLTTDRLTDIEAKVSFMQCNTDSEVEGGYTFQDFQNSLK